MKIDYWVYGLSCPIDKQVKYIGCSSNLNYRAHKYDKSNHPKFIWFKMLSKLGLEPELVLFSGHRSNRRAFNKEAQLIRKEKPLLNRVHNESNKIPNAGDMEIGFYENTFLPSVLFKNYAEAGTVLKPFIEDILEKHANKLKSN